MPKRVFLTPENISKITCPDLGEAWISDTCVRGFGVRIWRAPDGSKRMAFAIRKQSPSGKTIRSTYDIRQGYYDYGNPDFIIQDWKNNETRFPEKFTDHLPYARDWARDYLDRIKKNLPEYRNEIENQRKYQRERTLRYSLGDVANAIFKNLAKTNKSPNYVLQLEKLFFTHIPAVLQIMPANEVDIEGVWRALRTIEDQPGNFRSLRMIVRRIFAEFHSVSGTKNRYEKALYLMDEPKSKIDRIYNYLSALSPEEITTLICNLLNEKTFIMQSYCLYLFLFSNRAALSHCMSARWEDFGIRENQDSFLHHYSSQRVIWRHSSGPSNFENFGGNMIHFLNCLRDKALIQSDNKAYLFPSDFGYSKPYIQSIDTMWRHWLETNNMPYSSPAKFRAALRDRRRTELWKFELIAENS